MQKDEKRKLWLKERAGIPAEEKERASGAIFEKFVSVPEYINADWLFIYVSMKNEVSTTDIINRAIADGKKIAVPVSLKNRDMFFAEIKSFDNLVKNRLGVYEPVCGRDAEKMPTKNTVLVVPGVAFDENGGRMGYGGGYYDTYIEKYGVQNTVALAFECQIKDSVPKEEHDRIMKKIITDKRIIVTE